MEYTQWEDSNNLQIFQKVCLNPCCNGIYSMRSNFMEKLVSKSLNPCCNGIYSMRLYYKLIN